MAKERIPDSIKGPLSLKADYADPHLYGGTAAIVGIVALILGGGFMLFGGLVWGGFLAGLGAILFVAGFLVARYGE